MLNDLFAHLQNVSNVKAPATREFSMPAQVRDAWIREVLLRTEAVTSMDILEGPTFTSQSKDASSGTVRLRSVKDDPNEHEFQDITIDASWSLKRLDALKMEHKRSTVRITHTNSGAEIAVLTAEGYNLPESLWIARTIYSLIEDRSEQVAK